MRYKSPEPQAVARCRWAEIRSRNQQPPADAGSFEPPAPAEDIRPPPVLSEDTRPPPAPAATVVPAEVPAEWMHPSQVPADYLCPPMGLPEATSVHEAAVPIMHGPPPGLEVSTLRNVSALDPSHAPTAQAASSSPPRNTTQRKLFPRSGRYDTSMPWNVTR